MIPNSVLDTTPVLQGSDATQAFRNTLDLAQHAERWGYVRYWLAEHHNMPGIASAATSVVIGHVAGGTSTIRVGSGGVMLPNHAPLVIAEQFGTLASLYPGRIDLGLGRAPGTDGRTAQALRRNLQGGDTFPQDVLELQSYFQPLQPGQLVRAIPGAGLNVPIWLLGSSLFSAQLAAYLGLPFAFASHFAPDAMLQALAIYRENFRPSEQRDTPYAMLGLNICAADSDAEAPRLFTSLQQQWTLLRRGSPAALPPPVDTMDAIWSDMERDGLQHALARAIVGSAETVGRKLKAFIAETDADEIIMTSQIFDHRARLRSFEIVAQIRDGTLSV
jgi:luciferase family oxidoreductase group 1